ncbi:MAG: sulfotransferase [Chloroflexota bacterium]|nr:sulfotransferase [Chloroflexota bacterium]
MPVCIAGMHRSGTSMYARLLNRCGVYLGEEGDLIPASSENLDGYWENARFVALNDDLLNAFGGAWDHPPAFPDDGDAKSFAAFAAQSAPLLGTFGDREPWGWKDPRNSLTLPFWLRVFPEMKVVICVRNPLEVVLSLRQRSQSTELSLTLWYHYNQSVLRAVPPAQRIVAHYDQCFQAPQTELRRIVDFLGLAVTTAQINEACAGIRTDLRHHRYTIQELRDLGIAPEIIALYADLCAEAGAIAEESGERTSNALDAFTHHRASASQRTMSPTRVADNNGRGAAVSETPSPVHRDGSRATLIGQFDRAAMDAIVLRNEVTELTAHLAAAREEHAQQDIWTRELEERLIAAGKAAQADHEEQEAWARELEQRLVRASEAAGEEHAKQDLWARELERRLALAHDEHQRLLDWAHELQRQLVAVSTAAREEHAHQDAWSTELERRLIAVNEDAREDHAK